MGANVTIYCLQNVTDYFEFERLCHDLMSLEGYSSIEPLGGFSDKGRDAVHVNRTERTVTIFAYSVREDWRVKLAEDASKVARYGHKCDEFVFITTAEFTPSQRDEAVDHISSRFGWRLDLFGIERLRVLLDVQHPQVKSLHPQVFPPEFLSFQSSIDTSKHEHLFISSGPEDRALADWLTRKLTAEGYLVWCERFDLLGGETYPDDIDDAIRHQAFRVIGLYSRASLSNLEVMRQRSLALSLGNERNVDFLIPLNVDGVTPDQLDRVTSSLQFIAFEDNWADGLRQLLKKLQSIGCPKSLPDGRRVAAGTFLERDVLSDQTELLYSNCLQIETMPEVTLRFEAEYAVPKSRLRELQLEWAYRRVNAKLFLSFHPPPLSVANEYQMKPTGSEAWRSVERIDGIWSRNLVSELLRKSLIVKCHEKGLQYCPHTKLHYFPWGLVREGRLKFTRPDGSKTYVKAAGERKYWRPSGSERYRYYLAPVFSVVQDLLGDFAILVYVRIRLSDTAGKALPRRTANSRRKHLCKDWWNKEWLDRLFAICYYLADDGKITIGEQSEDQIIINAVPVHMNAPLGVNEDALDQLS